MNQREHYSYSRDLPMFNAHDIVKIFLVGCMINAVLLNLLLSICKTVTFFPLSADLTISSKSESCNWAPSTRVIISPDLIN